MTELLGSKTFRRAIIATGALLVLAGTALAETVPKHAYGASASDPVRMRSLTGTPEFRASPTRQSRHPSSVVAVHPALKSFRIQVPRC